MRTKEILILFAVVLLGFILRIVNLQHTPPSLNWDEVSHGWNAFSILKTGHDEWGKVFPISNFRAYGDYPLPLNLYLTIPSLVIFGLNEFAIRFPHVLLGAGTIVSTFFLVRTLKLGFWASILSALFVAVDPWTLFPSRAVFQSNLSIFFVTTGLAFFFYRDKRILYLPLSILFLGLSVFSYHNARIFVPLFVISLVYIWKNELLILLKKERKHFILSIGLLIAFFVPLVAIFSNPESRARSKWVFVIDQGAVNRIIEQRQSSHLPREFSRMVYNKYTYFTSVSGRNYINYFSPQFLFFNGGTQYQYSVSGKGVLYPINIVFFYAGILFVFLASLRKKKQYQTLFAWLLLGLVPAAITEGEFHVIRSTTILPLPQIFVAIGLAWFWNQIKNKRHIFKISKILPFLLVVSYLVLLAFMVVSYLKVYFGDYSQKYSWAWQAGYKDAVEYARNNYNEYEKIIITKKYGEPHEFFLFYWPWDPQKYADDKNTIRFYQSNWYWVDRFDKFYFVNDWDIPKVESGKWKMESGGEISMSGKTLLITSPANYPPDWKLLKTINFLGGNPAFDILEKQ